VFINYLLPPAGEAVKYVYPVASPGMGPAMTKIGLLPTNSANSTKIKKPALIRKSSGFYEESF
jgi:hypothetical protein